MLSLFLLFMLGFAEAPESPAAEAILELPDLAGQVHRLENYHGKVVVLNFWATWCGPCVKEMPIFVEGHKRFGKQGVVILAASLDSEATEADIPAFVKKYKMNFPVLTGSSPDHLEAFGLGEMLPATVFLDRDGIPVFRIIGQAHKKEVFERIEWLLGKRRGKSPKAIIHNIPNER